MLQEEMRFLLLWCILYCFQHLFDLEQEMLQEETCFLLLWCILYCLFLASV